ncbi:hypothetical protein Nm8I071_23020 [Nonomuraea sp. TT08I-71]|nr:hypothetical protein Nm8I071_23020 [Nonomuraea sp. TT08I-71]
MINLNGLTKRYGAKVAVDDLTLSIRPGAVTGFLGPNGAGKSTTMRMILGLDRPTAGVALVHGVRYADLKDPLRVIGAQLDARAVHPGRSVRAHLWALARSNGVPKRRVAEVIGQVGLETVSGRRAGTLSLGMSQRLGIAAALLGDPEILMFDEPVNGLDPDGVRWFRLLARMLATDGRTVFVSSHLMSEMQITADHLVVIGRGRLLHGSPTTPRGPPPGGQSSRVADSAVDQRPIASGRITHGGLSVVVGTEPRQAISSCSALVASEETGSNVEVQPMPSEEWRRRNSSPLRLRGRGSVGTGSTRRVCRDAACRCNEAGLWKCHGWPMEGEVDVPVLVEIPLTDAGATRLGGAAARSPVQSSTVCFQDFAGVGNWRPTWSAAPGSEPPASG